MHRMSGWALLLTFLTTGCGASGAFQSGKYENPLYGYRLEAKTSKLLAPTWKLDNYQFDGDGQPTEPKKGQVSTVRLDVNGDGEYKDTGKHPSLDLRFDNTKDDGVIWLRSVPVSQDMAEKHLKVLTHHWVSSLSGTGEFRVYDQEAGTSMATSKGTTSRIVAEGAGTLSGYEAFFARVELTDLERLKADPNHVEAVIEIGLVRSDYTWSAKGQGAFPVYLLVGYQNHPDYFEAGLKDFHALLGSLNLKPPARLPQPVATKCELGKETIHGVVHPSVQIGRKGWLRTVESDPETESCMNKALSKIGAPKSSGERERAVVYSSTRGAQAKTTLPRLKAKGAGGAPAEAEPAKDAESAEESGAAAEAAAADGAEPPAESEDAAVAN